MGLVLRQENTMIESIQKGGGQGSRRPPNRGKAAAVPERTKGEAVKPEAVLQLIAKIGVTAAHRALGVSTTTLHKARKPNAVVSRVIELASESKLRELQTEEHTLGVREAKLVTSPAAPRSSPPGEARVVVMVVPADRADQLERIALAWGAEFTKA